MKKVALVFVLAVLLPSLVLAWLAARSLRDQQFLLERQQSLLDQHVTDTIAQNISGYLEQRQQEFAATVETLVGDGDARSLAVHFDDQLRQRWPLADVGFCVTTAGKILSPLPNARPAAQMFRLDNSGFLGNREPVEVYWNANGAGKLEGQMELARAAGNDSSRTRQPARPEDMLKEAAVPQNAGANTTLAVNGNGSTFAFNNASVETPSQAQAQFRATRKLAAPNAEIPLPDKLSAGPIDGNVTVTEKVVSGGGGGGGGERRNDSQSRAIGPTRNACEQLFDSRTNGFRGTKTTRGCDETIGGGASFDRGHRAVDRGSTHVSRCRIVGSWRDHSCREPFRQCWVGRW
jgi:hypothetical protein